MEPHRTVIRGMMPRTSSLATGAVPGVAAHAAMNAIDPDHKMNRVASEATEGAIAGGIGAGAASALGASAALGPEVLAGASAYIAGSESGRAITNALEQGGASHDTAEAVGSVSGGAIGGVTASTVATGATIAGSMAFGAEAGGRRPGIAASAARESSAAGAADGLGGCADWRSGCHAARWAVIHAQFLYYHSLAPGACTGAASSARII